MPAGRCIVFLILMFSFSIYQFYSASIVGSLLMEKPKSIKTIRNLIDSSLRLGIEDIVYNKDFFRVSAECVCILLSGFVNMFAGTHAAHQRSGCDRAVLEESERG